MAVVANAIFRPRSVPGRRCQVRTTDRISHVVYNRILKLKTIPSVTTTFKFLLLVILRSR